MLITLQPSGALGQSSVDLETRLKSVPLSELTDDVNRSGDARRGALVFYKSAAACVQCHGESADQKSPLGPSLASIGKDVTISSVIESILYPSRQIKSEFQTWRVLTVDGEVFSGLISREDEQQLVLRDAQDLQREIIIDKQNIEERVAVDVSLMPTGLTASLREQREFLDLVRYVVDVAQGGQKRADELRPAADLLVIQDDTINLDHRGILEQLNEDDHARGQKIYFNHCVNCHGADGNRPALASARAFGTDKLKFGTDPLGMLKTLTLGNGLMGSMQHLSPKERYQVIYFIRENFMRDRNPGYAEIDAAYLASLPKGTDGGEFLTGDDRDFGPVLASQLGDDINNALTFRLPNALTVNYDLHRFRLGGVWTGGFLDLSETQHYRQRGEEMPQPAGTPIVGLDCFAWELNGSFEIDKQIKPTRGPVDADVAAYHGHYLYDDRAILRYAIAGREVLETIWTDSLNETPIVQHTFHIAAGAKPLRLRVAERTRDGEVAIEDTLAFVPSSGPKESQTARQRNEPIHVVSADRAKQLDLGTSDRTFMVRFKSSSDGTLIASAPLEGKWVRDGKSLFIRNGKLVFDIGWLGAMQSKAKVTDNRWHTAAVVVSKQKTYLYLDGKLQNSADDFRRDAVANHVLKLGATATDFGGDFSGQIDWAAIYESAMNQADIAKVSGKKQLTDLNAIWTWTPGTETPQDRDSTIASSPIDEQLLTANAVVGDTDGLFFSMTDEQLVLTIPASNNARVFRLQRCSITASQQADFNAFMVEASKQTIKDPQEMTHGGSTRWPQRITLAGSLGEPLNGYSLDTLPVPFENPWNAWLRTTSLDFFDDGRAVVTTHGGDVYLVSGIDDQLNGVTWKRFAAGLFEPFGVRVVAGKIYVTCHDGIKRLHDFDGNEEADFIESFWNDDDVSSVFHSYNFDLQTDSAGNFYLAKAGQHTDHHRPGSIMKIPADGGSAEVFAWGVRTPNGMGKLADDRFTVSDNQGPWMPAGKISLIKRDGFYGNMPMNDTQDKWLRSRHGGELPTEFDQPMIWMPQELDNSCGGQVWAGDERWGPLSGRLIHSSFGKGWLYYLSMQDIGEITQASIVALPHQWDAGVMRLRVNPLDGQVYGTGLSGWQGPQGGRDGCLQRLRYVGPSETHNEPRIIERTTVVPGGIELTFNFDVAEDAADPNAWQAEMWNYLWSRKYGSDQYRVGEPDVKGRDELAIESIVISPNKRTVTLRLPDLQTCDQVRIDMQFHDAAQNKFREEIYFTVHAIPAQ
jgi:putative heme-binding domain-containing protein